MPKVNLTIAQIRYLRKLMQNAENSGRDQRLSDRCLAAFIKADPDYYKESIKLSVCSHSGKQ